MTALNHELSQMAHTLALEHRVSRTVRRDPTRKQLRKNAAFLREYGQFVQESSPAGAQPAEEWLLDHLDFLTEQSLNTEIELTKSVHLPRLASGRTRIYELCCAYLEGVEGALQFTEWLDFIQAYQEVSALTQAEIWSLPVYLRAALLADLSDGMEHVRSHRVAGRQVADWLAQVWQEKRSFSAGSLRRALDEAKQSIPLSGPVIVQLIEQLREWADDDQELREWLSCRLESGVSDLDRLVSYEHQLQARQQVRAEHLILSLRHLARNNWRESSAVIHRVEQTLTKELAGTYGQMDFASRDLLCRRIGTLARQFAVPEMLVAQQAVTLADRVWAQANEPTDTDTSTDAPPRSSYVAYYLLDGLGMRQLRKALQTCAKPRPTPTLGALRHIRPVYAVTLIVLTCSFTCLMATLLAFDSPSSTGRIGALALSLLALLLPASEWAIATAHWLIECGVPTRHLLRMDYSKGVPITAKTLVVVPVVWSSPDEVHELAERLELHYLATRDPHVYFALLGDFCEANSPTQPTDDSVLQSARSAIDTLNKRYAQPDGSPFFLFHRSRVWSDCEQVYMGWERKRGKLVQLVEWLTSQNSAGFDALIGEFQALLAVRYVITLDADTQLPLGAAQRMIGAIDLPFHRPRLNQAGTRVVEGYGVLQPRIGIKHEAIERSWLAALWAGAPGIDPYAFAVSDPYQDAFGEGIFTGKGIFAVQEFARTLCERLPDNRVLSHDLLEGGFMRAALLADVELIDDHPATFAAFQMRLHRWVRGDWQLLLWLLPRVANRRGALTPVDLTALTRWQMIDNLRRSLMPSGLLLIWLLGWTVLPGRHDVWAGIVLATIGIPLIRHCATVPRLLRHPEQLPILFGQVIIAILLLPFQAALFLDAIGRTLWRLVISRKRLLEWVHSAEVERRQRTEGRQRLVNARLGYGFVILFAMVIWWIATPDLALDWLILCAIWAFAPGYAQLLDRPVRRAKVPLTAAQQSVMRTLARQIWSYYEHFAGVQDHYLPPDNVQLEANVGVAHRTSPTNIGLLLSAQLAAYDLGELSACELLDRTSRTLATIEQLVKWEGHLYNWYDTQTLEPLPPQYVSTVDSGNFIASLISVRMGLLALRLTSTPESELANVLAERLEAIIQRTNFRPLYDDDAHLFTLGYHVSLNLRETILYDLMASESRQASFVAIALGQVSVSHWFALGRAQVMTAGIATMLSWTGTMFEYFMPPLFMRVYRGTLWEQTYRGALARQQEYARAQGVPWGVSESGYFAFDYQMNYQYRAFGVPGLGYKRGLESDLVIAPYATLLAFPFAPEQVLANLQRLDEWGAHGEYGYYEAIDCTPERMPQGQTRAVIRSYMAHHQGMALLAIVNGLHDDIMVRRFHSDPRVAATELLLQERIPPRPTLVRQPILSARRPGEPALAVVVPAPREYTQVLSPSPEVCVLSNGSFTTVLTQSGDGYCQVGDQLVTRWREESMASAWGPGLYIHQLGTDAIWSPAFHPCRTTSPRQRVLFASEKATFQQVVKDLEATLEVCVSTEHDADLRKLTLVNISDAEQIIEITSYQELSLSLPAADEAHPAFNKLFVETQYEPDSECLIAHRRTRSKTDKTIYVAHTLTVADSPLGAIEYTTDRATFIGRGHDLSQPQELHGRLPETVGAVLDPAFVMRRRVTIAPGKRIELYAVLATADSRAAAIAHASRVANPQAFARALQLAWTRTRIELRHEHMDDAEAALFQTLAGRALYSGRLSSERRTAIATNTQGQTSLWSQGLSGDLPIVLITITDVSEVAFIAKLARGHRYLRRLGLKLDLVILCETSGGYRQDLRKTVVRASGAEATGSGPGGIHVLGADQLAPAFIQLLYALARVTLTADGPSLKTQLRAHFPTATDASAPAATTAQPTMPAATVGADCPSDATPHVHTTHADWLLFNGWGGFSADGDEYRIALRGDCNLPAPWTNVLANPKFGCLITELGTGYTWWLNSRECKLTPWRNDPIMDQPSEVCYLRDEETGSFWSLTPSPVRGSVPYTIAHGRGYSRFSHVSHGIAQEMTVFVPIDDSVKVIQVQLVNQTAQARQLSLSYFAQWTIGVNRDAESAFIVSDWDDEVQALIAHNTYQETFRDAHAFLHLALEDGRSEHEANLSYTSDQLEFVGVGGTLAAPAALLHSAWANGTGAYAQPCGALRGQFILQPGEARTVYVLLGCAASPAAVRDLLIRYREPEHIKRQWQRLAAYWQETLDQIRVTTPSPEFNALVNGWLVYQALACRMWARTAFYQAGGAYGFRDQLQDSLALLHTRPDLTRSQLLLHAAHQFSEGDVQHWWHEETKRGIRTRYSDDLLWLPYVTARYTEHTGDLAVLDEQMAFLQDALLRPEEHERYGATVQSAESANLYEHCKRAIKKELTFGEHQLPLIGSGDWNDGLNLVGPEGRGESVWLGWFLCDVLNRFAIIAKARADDDFARTCDATRVQLAEALEISSWDGQWYRRAFTDHGTWLGSIHDAECRIDAIAQSWSVLSGAAPKERAEQAMRAVDRELVDRKLAIIRLLTPPFDQLDPSPGYIQGYPPGIRENGGQYTHGVIWGIIAWCQLGNGDKAFEWFDMINPLTHTRTPGEVATYAGEPYVMAADVYANGPHKGRAGWTWYTGAASWMYQAAIEWIIGLRRSGAQLTIDPCLPSDWPEISVEYKYGRTSYQIAITRGTNERFAAPLDTLPRLELDGHAVTTIDLRDDELAHQIHVYV